MIRFSGFRFVANDILFDISLASPATMCVIHNPGEWDELSFELNVDDGTLDNLFDALITHLTGHGTPLTYPDSLRGLRKMLEQVYDTLGC